MAEAPRFLCDRMLGRLSRCLRAAGFDAALAEAECADAGLLRRSVDENRILLSRDRRLVADAGSHPRALLLTGDALDDQALQLRAALGVDWMRAPFTRCLVDNAPLRPAEPDEMARIPERARALPGPFRACPECGRVFWPGSHVRRMLDRLRRWRDGLPSGG